MITLKEKAFGIFEVVDDDEKDFSATLVARDDFSYTCLFSQICLNAAASILHDGECRNFHCPHNCQFRREQNGECIDEHNIVVFPADGSPCYVLPASALRTAKRLAPNILIRDDEEHQETDEATEDNAQAVDVKGGEA